MKNRKNQSTPVVSLEEPSRILFVSDQFDSRLAQLIFDTEARKMEVYWIASAGCLNSDGLSKSNSTDLDGFSESLVKLGVENLDGLRESPPSVTIEDLQKAKLTVLIQKSGCADLEQAFATLFPSVKNEMEVWKVSLNDEVDQLLQDVKSLLIRLILKGGKRAPVPAPVMSSKPDSKLPVRAGNAVRVRLESKGRGGKKVTVVYGLEIERSELETLATALKQTCGTGGTVKDETIEIQGDQCERVLTELKRRGIQAKRSGG